MKLPSQKFETTCTEIWLDEDGILHLKIKEDAELDVEEVKKCFEIYRQLGCDNAKVLQLIEGGSFFTMEENAQRYAARMGKKMFIASALVHDSLAVRLLFNFFNSFNKTSVPFKIFSNREKAIQWLREFSRQ